MFHPFRRSRPHPAWGSTTQHDLKVCRVSLHRLFVLRDSQDRGPGKTQCLCALDLCRYSWSSCRGELHVLRSHLHLDLGTLRLSTIGQALNRWKLGCLRSKGSTIHTWLPFQWHFCQSYCFDSCSHKYQEEVSAGEYIYRVAHFGHLRSLRRPSRFFYRIYLFLSTWPNRSQQQGGSISPNQCSTLTHCLVEVQALGRVI